MQSTRRNIAAQVRQLPQVTGYYLTNNNSSSSHRQDHYYSTAANPAVCPHLVDNNTNNAGTEAAAGEVEWEKAVPYAKIPGPRAIPILGNTFR